MCVQGKAHVCVFAHTHYSPNQPTDRLSAGTAHMLSSRKQCSQEPSGGPRRAPAAPLTPHAPQQTGLWVQHLVFSPTYLLDGSWVSRSQHGFTARGHQIHPCSVSLGLCSRPDEVVVTSCRLYPFCQLMGRSPRAEGSSSVGIG